MGFGARGAEDVCLGQCVYFRPRRSCGKVILSQASVSHSVHRGGCLPQCMLGYTHPQEAHTPWADTPTPGSISPASIPPGNHTSPGSTPPEKHIPPPPTVTAADGMYPTGMLCFCGNLAHFSPKIGWRPHPSYSDI